MEIILKYKGNSVRSTVFVLFILVSNYFWAQKTRLEKGSLIQQRFLFHQAEQQKLSGNPDEAIKIFKEALKIEENGAIYFEMASLVDESEQISLLEKAYLLDDNNLWYKAFYIEALLENGELDKTNKLFSEKYPSNNSKLNEVYLRVKEQLKDYSSIDKYYQNSSNVKSVENRIFNARKLEQNQKRKIYKEIYSDRPANNLLIYSIIHSEDTELLEKLKINYQPNIFTSDFSWILYKALHTKKIINPLRLYLSDEEVVLTIDLLKQDNLFSMQNKEEVISSLSEEHWSDSTLIAFQVMKESLLSKEDKEASLLLNINDESSLEDWLFVLSKIDKTKPDAYEKAQQVVELFPFQPKVFVEAANIALQNNKNEQAAEWLDYAESILSASSQDLKPEIELLRKRLN